MLEKIVDLCLKQFNSLPKTGKPKDNEWTILSCIVIEQNSSLEVVALGTGSKCIGKSKMCPKGTIINDSHAEVMCRRAFLRYLYSNLQKNSLIFTFNEATNKFSLKPTIKFNFFTTHVPCGDAAIFPKEEEEDEDIGEPLIKKRKIIDINRTGAKCIDNQDPKAPGSKYHIIGVVRTKPGRGDPTVSVSCSDKLAKWCHLGLQGSLLMNFLDKPIYLNSLILLKDCNFSEEALQRALFKRLGNVELIEPYSRNLLNIYQVDKRFLYEKVDNKLVCASSIIWSKNYHEVAVNGRKQGVTKKHLYSEKGRLKICKLEFFKLFLNKLNEFVTLKTENITYSKAKKLDKIYQENWKRLKEKFGAWTVKDSKLLEFTGK